MNAPDVERYMEALNNTLPVFTADEQRAALTLYRQLAIGDPVGHAQLATDLNVPPATAIELLARPSLAALTYRDAQGRIVGFGGLATQPMHHQFTVNDRALWTWCAWDSLFIPELLQETAHVESRDPETGEMVVLDVAPNEVAAAPAGVVVSFPLPDSSTFTASAGNIMATFCHFIFFFASRTSGERWVAKHPGTFLYPLADAVTIARRINARNFGLELARLATGGAE